MIQTGIVGDISGADILVEPIRGEPGEGSGCCGSGGCDSCANKAKVRRIKVGNPKELTVRAGNLVRYEVSSGLVVLAAFRLLILPPALFAAFYLLWDGVAGLTGGIAAAVTVILANFLLRKKTAEREKPVLVEVL